MVKIKPQTGIIMVDICNFKNSRIIGPQWKYIWNFAGKKLSHAAASENIFREQFNYYVEQYVLRPSIILYSGLFFLYPIS